ncbi:nuclear pore complex protein Nup153-like [Rhopilema esculentum]|uniref:nuclear pore complex protein Nup153-like n=1 Tax=Rhopilema esculentum TaxID=499914 RepID=UPI0031DD6804|eukprot:gene10684-19451_t
MDPEDRLQKPQATGKIRVSHGGRIRAKPYSRKKVKQPEEGENKAVAEKGFLGKVASYVVPQWISSWFSNSKQTIEEEDQGSECSENSDDVSNDDEVDDNDESSSYSHPDKSNQILIKEDQNLMISNHVSQSRPKKNITSTPMVRNMPSFTILSSEARDPKEGSSKQMTDEVERNNTTKRSSFQLLSVDTDDGEDTLPPTKQERTEHGPSLLNSFQFSMGAKPSGPPQRFLTAKNRPSFKVSSFVSSSPLIPESSASSTFYPGRTSFGGASSLQSRTIKRQRVSPVALSTHSRKTSIKPKSLSNLRMGAVTSDTARKILGALEKMSSPVRDASKLPGSPSSVLFNPPKKRKESLLSSPVNRSSRLANKPPAGVLMTPQSLHIQQLERRKTEPQILKFGEIRQSVPVGTFKSRGLPTSFSPEENYKAGGKMKHPRQSSHQAAVKDIQEEPVNTLPEIRNAPPLVLSSLPKISFENITVSSANTLSGQPSVIKTKLQTENDKQVVGSYQFSEPEKISDESLKPVGKGIKNTFQFSTPVAKDAAELRKEANKEGSKKALEGNAKDLSEPNNTCDQLKSDEVKKVQSKSMLSSKFMSTKSGWECGTCMVFNSDNHVECIACKSKKPSHKVAVEKSEKDIGAKLNHKEQVTSNNKDTLQLKSKFKPPEGSWDCPQCMVNNAAASETCIACSTSRNTVKKESQKSTVSSLASKFKADAGSWECPTCMLQNKSMSQECIACSAKKPTSVKATGSAPAFGSTLKAKFAASAGSWECDSCLVKNDSDKNVCIACNSKKPENKRTTSSSGSLLKGKFAAKEQTWECETCMVPNKADALTCIACTTPKKGSSAPAKPTVPSFSFGTGSSIGTGSTINFGVDKDSSKGLAFGKTAAFKFGESSGSGGVNFGADGNKGFVFGSASTGFSGISFGNSENSVSSAPEDKDKKGFSFGSTKNSGGVDFGTNKGFSFGAPKFVMNSDAEAGEKSIKKTEENNNLSHASPEKSALTGSNAVKDPEIMPIFAAPVKSSGGIRSIADAAQAGLLKVPGVGGETTEAKSAVMKAKADPFKSSFSTTLNGPVPNDVNSKTKILFNAKASEQMASDNAVPKTGSNMFDFGSAERKKEQNIFGESSTGSFNFTTPTSTDQPQSIGNSFSFSSGNPSLFKSEEGVAGGSQPNDQLVSKKQSLEDTSSQVKNSVPGKFSFGQIQEQNVSSLFGNSQSSSEKQVTSPFQFNTGAAKPTVPVFGQNSLAGSASTAGKNLFGNSIGNPILSSNTTDSKGETNSFAFSSNPVPSLFQNVKSNQENPFGLTNAQSFNFTSNLNKNPGNSFVFGSPKEQRTGTQDIVNPTGSSVGNSISFANSTSDATVAKPFSFTEPSSGNQGSSPFKSGSTEPSSNIFASSTPATNTPAAGFNFGGSPGTASFSFGANSNANAVPAFSVGSGSASPANRPMHKAVRRLRK